MTGMTIVVARRSSLLVSGCLVLQMIAGMESVGAGNSDALWRQTWEKTVEAAKREGQVTVYIGGWAEVLDAGVFQKTYPQIKVVGVGGGAQLTQRLITERRAGKFLADVSINGHTANYLILYHAKVLDPIKPALILPEVGDESRWWQGKHRYMDLERQYVFRFAGSPTFGISYNTNLVSPKQVKSYWDILNPSWKGKILARDVRGAGYGTDSLLFLYYHPDLGPKFLHQLFSGMEVMLFRDLRQGTNWLAGGKFAICFQCAGISQAVDQGLPVKEFGPLQEGAGIGVRWGTIALLKNAPHPNAAKVFINWFLSREGQLALQRVAKSSDTVPDSLRVDIPKDDVPLRDRRFAGVNYLDPYEVGGEWEPVRMLIEKALAEIGDGEKKAR